MNNLEGATMDKHRILIAALMILMFSGIAGQAAAQPCLIFVHGKQTNTNTYTNYASARNYWVNGSNDFIRVATKQFATSFYVVGYNGTQPYWSPESAGEVSREIIDAANGIADGGGHRCSRTYAQGGTFWVIAHSMGNTVMDFILGNFYPTDPNYNFNGRYDQVQIAVSVVVSIGGTHRGSQGADAACGDSTQSCNFFGNWIQDCDAATFWLRSSEDVQVRAQSAYPGSPIWLIGGYQGSLSSDCLSGEDDSAVQYASAYACNGSAAVGYNNSNVCNNSNKQETWGFLNIDAAYEDHFSQKDASDADQRRAIPDGRWYCNGVRCAPNTIVRPAMTTAEFVTLLY
jgi:hypothetical protein